jgi:hypothetical protein
MVSFSWGLRTEPLNHLCAVLLNMWTQNAGPNLKESKKLRITKFMFCSSQGFLTYHFVCSLILIVEARINTLIPLIHVTKDETVCNIVRTLVRVLKPFSNQFWMWTQSEYLFINLTTVRVKYKLKMFALRVATHFWVEGTNWVI